MFTQAFLRYINRHAEITGEGEKGREREETDREGTREETEEKKKHQPSIHPPLPSVYPPLSHVPVLRVYTEQGNKEHISQCTFVRSMQRS